jgi:UDP:flavonoid glycosyltransferase YjiC (YdhE family)
VRTCAKVMIIAHVGETVGHLVRAISLAETLLSVGVCVQLACDAQAQLILRERLSGLAVQRRDIQWNWSHNAHSKPTPSAYHAMIEKTNRDLLQLLDHEQPDLIISIPGVFTAQAARSRGIPQISVLHGPYVSPILNREPFTPTERIVLDFVSELMVGGIWDSILAHLSRSLKLPWLTYQDFLSKENIAVAQPGLDLPAYTAMSQCDFILASYGTTPSVHLPRETCYITFGSGNPCDITSVIDVAAKHFPQVVVTSGFASSITSKSNVLIRQSIPSDYLAGRVGAVISHGGVGTVGAFAAHGTPHLIIPTEPDQATMAVHAPRLGVAAECGLDSWALEPRWGRRIPSISNADLDDAVSVLYKESLNPHTPLLKTSGAVQITEMAIGMLNGN